MCSWKADCMAHGAQIAAMAIERQVGGHLRSHPAPGDASHRYNVLNSLAASLLAAINAGHTNVSCFWRGNTQVDQHITQCCQQALLQGSVLLLQGQDLWHHWRSDSVAETPVASQQPPHTSTAQLSAAGMVWEMLARFNAAICATSLFTSQVGVALAPQPPCCTYPLLLPRHLLYFFAYSVFCFLPHILAYRHYVCQGTGSSLLMPLSPFPRKYSVFAFLWCDRGVWQHLLL